MGRLMNFEKSGNLIEAALWFGVSLAWTVKSVRGEGRLRVIFSLLAAAFFVFAITDLIESETGAWWRPLWLLGLKALCVVGFVGGFAAYYSVSRKKPEVEP
jgi:hypothetical protein